MFTYGTTCYGSLVTLSYRLSTADATCVIGGSSAWFQHLNLEPKT